MVIEQGSIAFFVFGVAYDNIFFDIVGDDKQDSWRKNSMRPVTKNDFLRAFRSLGLEKGHTLMVHSSLSKFGYVCGGAQTVIEALLETVGEE